MRLALDLQVRWAEHVHTAAPHVGSRKHQSLIVRKAPPFRQLGRSLTMWSHQLVSPLKDEKAQRILSHFHATSFHDQRSTIRLPPV